MKIIIISDIHGNRKNLDYVLQNYDADYYYDCGDSELLKYQLKEFDSVLGNCDYDYYPDYRIVKINEHLSIFITHGHLYSLEEMIFLAKQKGCNVIAHGHSHIMKHEIIDGIHIINPGSLSKPRNSKFKSFCVINYNKDKKEFKFEFIKLDL